MRILQLKADELALLTFDSGNRHYSFFVSLAKIPPFGRISLKIHRLSSVLISERELEEQPPVSTGKPL
jgi:hypothetical protein